MTKATPERSDALVFECHLDEAPAKVWRALTEPQLLEAWLGTDDPARARSPGEASCARQRPAEYEILSAEPHRLLRYRWRDRASEIGDSGDREVHSVVTVELAPSLEGGTHLRLTHGDFTIVSAAPAMAAVRVRPIASARRVRGLRSATVSLAASHSLRRAA